MKKNKPPDIKPIGKNDLRVIVGFVKGKALINPVPVSDCKGPYCPIYDKCHHRKNGKCRYEQLYIDSFYVPLVDPLNGIGDKLSQRRLNEIGTKLLPLMQRAVKLMIDILAIEGIRHKPFSTAYMDSKGRYHMYPQFKAFDDAIKLIDALEDKLKLTEIWEKKFGGDKLMPSAGAGAEEIFKSGRRGAYEELLQETVQAEAEADQEEEAECPADRAEELHEEMPDEYDALYDGNEPTIYYTEDGGE